jgi:hypothetical protein
MSLFSLIGFHRSGLHKMGFSTTGYFQGMKKKGGEMELFKSPNVEMTGTEVLIRNQKGMEVLI